MSIQKQASKHSSPTTDVGGGKVSIACTLTRGSLTNTDYVFVKLFLPGNGRTAWVPRKDVVIREQRLNGPELDAALAVNVCEEREDDLTVEISNKGKRELIQVPRSHVLAR